MALADDFHLNVGQSTLLHPQLDGCGMREIQNSTIHIWSAVGDTHVNVPSIGQIHDPHNAAERHGPVSGSQRFHVEDFAVRCLLTMKLFTVPGSDPAIFDAGVESGITFRNPGACPKEQPRDRDGP
jgi:hypothetical protein